MKQLLQNHRTSLLFILGFFILSAVYFSPLISGQKVMFQHDIQQAKGMAQEITAFEEKTGENSLWTNSMFSGMPVYQIGSKYPGNLTRYLFSTLTYLIGYDRYPITSLWLLFTCFFIMLLTFEVNVWIAGAISVAYGLSGFNIIGIEAGHANKVWTLMYTPLIFAAIKMAFDQKLLPALALITAAMALNVYANHLQVTYYAFLAVLIWLPVQLVFAIKEKKVSNFIKASAVLGIGAFLGVATNTSTLWTTYEYGKESTRGGSELTIDQGASNSGLDYSYVFDDYSYGRFEQITFLAANFYGGSSGSDLPKDSEVGKLIGDAKGMPTYWGTQRYVAGPYYLGIILCALAIVAIVIVPWTALKIWLVITGFICLSLATGKNSLFLSDLFYNYFPFYNKFRTPTMITGITQMVIAILAAMGLQELNGRLKDKKLVQLVHYSFYSIGGFLLLLALFGSSFFDFSNTMDSMIPIDDPNFKSRFIQALQADRATLMQNDMWRSIVFLAITFGLIWLYLKEKIKLAPFALVFALLFMIDLWPVNNRYMSKDTYKPKRKNEALFTASAADQQILADPDLHYRVANLSVSTFNDATTSYFHRSIGGYHGAKLRRYQELIANHISPELEQMIGLLRSENLDPMAIDAVLKSRRILNMLNAKYYIVNPNGAPLKNQYAYGNAWVVNNLEWVKNADEEFTKLKSSDTRNTALVDEKWKTTVGDIKAGSDPNARISLLSYAPNKLEYDFNSSAQELVLFSEIYYPYGWQAYIDDQPVAHFRSNFVLRGLVVPAGKHRITFKFEPNSYRTGETISMASSIAMILLLLGIGGLQFRKPKPTS